MQIRSLLLFLLVLPALLLPEGLSFHLCWCDDMQSLVSTGSCCAPATPSAKSCCESFASSAGPLDRTQATLAAQCNGCGTASLVNGEIQPTQATHSELFAGAMPFAMAARVFVVEPPRFERSLRWTGVRTPAPPDRSRNLPLLI